MNVWTLVGTWWYVVSIGQCNLSPPILINNTIAGMKIVPSVARFETSNCAFGLKRKLIESIQGSSSQTFLENLGVWHFSIFGEL